MFSGFVYKWTDNKTGMCYIGKHRGTVDDGYVSSSTIFNSEYKKRPNDFTRELLWESSNTTDRELCKIESLYLSLIKKDEYYLEENCKYYNRKNNGADPYTNTIAKYGVEYEFKRRSERMIANTYGKGNLGKAKSEEHKRKISESVKKSYIPRKTNGGRKPAVPFNETIRIWKEMGVKKGAEYFKINVEAFKSRVALAKKKMRNITNLHENGHYDNVPVGRKPASGEIGETHKT